MSSDEPILTLADAEAASPRPPMEGVQMGEGSSGSQGRRPLTPAQTEALRKGREKRSSNIAAGGSQRNMKSDSAARDAAKPRSGRRPPQRPDRAPRASKRSLRKPLEELLATLGALAMLSDPRDGLVIIARGPRLAAALDDLAQQDARVHRALSLLVQGSTWTGVLTAALSIAMPILANHGIAPGPLGALFQLTPDELGDIPPAFLQSDPGGVPEGFTSPFGQPPNGKPHAVPDLQAPPVGGAGA